MFVRDVLTWLFTAISKSTEQAERPGAAREMEEQTRFIHFFHSKEPFINPRRPTPEKHLCVNLCCFISLLLQNSVCLPEDACAGAGGRSLSDSALYQSVPGTLPHARWHCNPTSAQVESRERRGKKAAGERRRLIVLSLLAGVQRRVQHQTGSCSRDGLNNKKQRQRMP